MGYVGSGEIYFEGVVVLVNVLFIEVSMLWIKLVFFLVG